MVYVNFCTCIYFIMRIYLLLVIGMFFNNFKKITEYDLIVVGNNLAAVVSAGMAANGESFDQAAANSAAEGTAAGAGVLLWLVLLVSVICFILSFMGKRKSSIVTGILIILGALFILVNGFVGFGSMLWGTATGVLYLVSGIVSITNHKKAK